MAMISSETQPVRLLRKTANLLDSVAEAAWTNDIPSSARWDLHRVGTEAYLAQREILDALGQDAEPCETLPLTDIAAALEKAALKVLAKEKGVDVQYVEARSEGLEKLKTLGEHAVIAAAVKVGATRLIDNRILGGRS